MLVENEKSGNSLENLKEAFLSLDEIVPTIDRIGSGFEGPELVSLALLLYFRETKLLDRLAKIRRIVSDEIEIRLTPSEFDVFIEQDKDRWRPPYGKTKDELLKLIREL